MQAAVVDFDVSFAEHAQRAGSPSAAALQRTRAILSARMVRAEAQAQGFGRAAASESRGVWQWLLAAAAVVGLSGAAFLYCKEALAPHITEPAAAVVIAARGGAVGSNPFAAPRAATALTPSVAGGTVRREGDAIVIALHDMPLAEAIAELAAATRTAVIGQPSDTRISLEWRGRDRSAAWLALLAGESGYALACDLPETTTSCRLWLTANQLPAPAQQPQ